MAYYETQPRPGRHFLQIPGPTNVPERVLRAMNRNAINHRGPDFATLGLEVIAKLRGVFQTEPFQVRVKLTEFEEPPPGEGLLTTTANVPGLAWSLALSEIVSCVGLTKVAGCATPL